MKQLKVPSLAYDGSFIDVLWDNHNEAVAWFEQYFGWEVIRQEDWKPDPRCIQGKMTQMNWGTWLVSSISNERLPHHYAERGTVEPNIRLCWRTRDLAALHNQFNENHIRTTELYHGSGNTHYFDFWVTCEGIRLTLQEDKSLPSKEIAPSWNRIGVRDIKSSVQWYETYMGMILEEDRTQDGYVVMRLKLNHQPESHSLWVIEKATDDAYIGQVDGQVRLSCWINDRSEFFEYHQYLKNSGIKTSEMGGFVDKGLVSFHFYDLDGNRFNVSSM